MMPEERCNFKCEAVPETWHDDVLGDLQVGRSTGSAEKAANVDDPDLGPIILDRSPAARGNPRRTLAPPAAELVLAFVVLLHLMASGFALAGVLHHG